MGILDQVEAFAGRGVGGAPERAAEGVFTVGKLGLCVVALAAAPVALAFAGAPSLAACGAFALTLTPLAAYLVFSRTGDLKRAGAVAVAGFLAFALALAFAAPQFAASAAAFAALAPLEAVLVGGTGLVAFASGGAAFVLAICAFIGFAAGSSWTAAALAGVAGLAMAWTAFGLLRVARARGRAGVAPAAEFAALAQLQEAAVLRMDGSGAVLGAVNAGVRVLEVPVAEFMGRGLFERVHVADRPLFLKTVSDASAARLAVQAEVRVRAAGDKSPSFGLVSLNVAPIADDAAAPVRLLAMLTDIGARKDQEQQLEAARAVAAESAASRDRFLANISHELRTPLNAIIGFSEILGSDLMPLDPARQREYAGIINASGQHLLQVVNSILDMSKIESGSFQINAEPFELAPLIDQCCDMMRLKADETGIAVSREVAANIPEIVGDKRAVKQILINLVSNAVKFTGPQGRVVVRARPAGAGIAIEVEDNGIGVAPSDLARLGDPFFQAQDSYDRPYEGTGLGLSVVRGLLGLHGGSMRIESALREGARVTVMLPLDYRTTPSFARTGLARIETVARGPFRASAPDEKVKHIA